MSDFDPDKYLKSQRDSESASEVGNFDPDSYLKGKGGLAQFPESENPYLMRPNRPGEAQAGLEAMGNAATLGYLPQIEAGVQGVMGDERPYVDRRDANIARHKQQAEQFPERAAGGKLAGMLGVGAALPATGSVVGAAAAGGALGAAYNPGDRPGVVDPIQGADRAANAGIGAVGGAVAQGATNAATSLARYLMKRGSGIAKFSGIDEDTKTEMAQRLLDQGSWGTRKSLIDQGARNGHNIESQIQNDVANAGNVDSTRVAHKIAGLVEKYKADGIIPADNAPKLSEILDRAYDVAQRGDVTAAQALKLGRMAERDAYKLAPGEVKPGIFPEIGRAEGRGYKEELTGMIPGLQDKLSNQRANILMQQGLAKVPRQNDLATMAHLAVAGPSGVGAGIAAKSPLVSTGLAQALKKGAQASKVLSPLSLQAILGGRNGE